MQVEDHPIEYANFEGVIPAGEYGGGTVMVWDKGTWEPEQPDPQAALEKGDLKFTLHGKKLQGSWVLVRTRGFGSGSKPSWLLIKHRDQYASTEDITEAQPKSAVSKRLLAELRAITAAMWNSPPPAIRPYDKPTKDNFQTREARASSSSSQAASVGPKYLDPFLSI